MCYFKKNFKLKNLVFQYWISIIFWVHVIFNTSVFIMSLFYLFSILSAHLRPLPVTTLFRVYSILIFLSLVFNFLPHTAVKRGIVIFYLFPSWCHVLSFTILRCLMVFPFDSSTEDHYCCFVILNCVWLLHDWNNSFCLISYPNNV